MPVFVIVIVYCILKSLYIMQKKHRLSTYLWMSAVQKFQSNYIKQRKPKINPQDYSFSGDIELGIGNSNGNITERKEIEISKEQISDGIKESGNKLISFPSIQTLEEENEDATQKMPKFFNWETFLYYFKIEFCGKSNRSLYSIRNISPKSRIFISFGMILYLLLSFFIYCTIKMSPSESFNIGYIQIFFFETLFALSFPNFITIVTCLKEFTFVSYLTRLVGLNLLHIILIAFQLKKLEALVFIYYMTVILFYCDPNNMKPRFQTENCHQNTLEMYHLTFLGKVHGRFMFFYVRRIDETNFRIVLAAAVNKQLQVHKELRFDNRNVHKVHYNKDKKILTLWTKSPDTGIEIALYHVPTLKCLQITSLYRSPAANVYGYENNQQKYCLINKSGHNVHLFEGNVYLTAIPIPGRPGAYDDFFVYETKKNGEVVLGKIQNSDETSEYRVFRIVKERKIWIAEDKIEFNELITHQILINDEKIIFISASWNIYIYDANTLKRLDVISSSLLPNSMYSQIKYHQEQSLFEVGISKERANFLIPDITKPKILARMEKKEFNSLFFLNYKPIILCFQKSGKFFKRTVNYSLYDLPKKDQLQNELTTSQTDLEKFYNHVPEMMDN